VTRAELIQADIRSESKVPVQWLALVALVLAALNLRPAVTSLGPVLAEARIDLGMSATVAGLLTAIPAVCFAVVGFAAPALARRYSPDVVVLGGVAVLAAGLALRPTAADTALFVLASAVALGGIAVVNVLMPVVVKRRFPQRVATMTGVYSMALNLGASGAAAVTVPIADGLGHSWRLGLAAWAVLAALAIPAWALLARRRAVVTGDVRPAGAQSIARSPIAWALAAYFGLQGSFAYVVIGWLPQIFRDAGISAGTAGVLFAVTSVLGVPLSLVLSALAGKLRGQSALALVLVLFGMAGFAGLWFAPAGAPWVWAVLLGVANCSFPLALTMIGLRGHDAATVARLSAFVQCVGYLFTVPGPIVVGALYQHTGGWRASIVFMLVMLVLQLIAGLFAGRDRKL
jgi:CP family cyanate transporter-like MFS transporter